MNKPATSKATKVIKAVKLAPSCPLVFEVAMPEPTKANIPTGDNSITPCKHLLDTSRIAEDTFKRGLAFPPTIMQPIPNIVEKITTGSSSNLANDSKMFLGNMASKKSARFNPPEVLVVYSAPCKIKFGSTKI